MVGLLGNTEFSPTVRALARAECDQDSEVTPWGWGWAFACSCPTGGPCSRTGCPDPPGWPCAGECPVASRTAGRGPGQGVQRRAQEVPSTGGHRGWPLTRSAPWPTGSPSRRVLAHTLPRGPRVLFAVGPTNSDHGGYNQGRWVNPNSLPLRALCGVSASPAWVSAVEIDSALCRGLTT